MKNVKKKTSPLKMIHRTKSCVQSFFLDIEQIHTRIKIVPFLIWRCLFFFLRSQFFSKFSKNGRKPTQTATKQKNFDGKDKNTQQNFAKVNNGIQNK